MDNACNIQRQLSGCSQRQLLTASSLISDNLTMIYTMSTPCIVAVIGVSIDLFKVEQYLFIYFPTGNIYIYISC